MLRSFRFAILSLLFTSPLMAQSVNFSINTELDTLSISPYIYGSNGQSDDTSARITARRLGGNRLTGYNWENNASNAGTDYLNHSDNYLTYGLADSLQNKPAIVPILFHKESQALGAYSLVTLPAAGFVARDKSGTVDASQVAPSSRWCQVDFQTLPPFVVPPDTADGIVSDNAEVSFLVQHLGSSLNGGIKGYNCDNEPALWPSTHPRIHPKQTTCAEVLARDSAVAMAVKSVDPNAEIFGPVAYGFEEYLTNQSAPDWGTFKSYNRWIDAYLAKMHASSNAAGKRLLDVLDLHWYPEAQGKSAAGQITRITPSDNTDQGIARARMDAPRTLWDSSYVENSWIAQYYSPVAILPWVNAAIKEYYPGTKLSFSELNYGGDHQISGAIAIADVLGIFGRYGVYMSNYWGTVGNYIASAYKIYRNYDGSGATFGDRSVQATTTNIDSTSIYAASRKNDADHLDVVLINKSFLTAFASTISIQSKNQFGSAQVFLLDATSTNIRSAPAITSIVNNTVVYTLPPLSVTHLVLQANTQNVSELRTSLDWSIRSAIQLPNAIRITLAGELHQNARVRLLDLLGRECATATLNAPSVKDAQLILPVARLSTGVYLLSVESGGRTATFKIVSQSETR